MERQSAQQRAKWVERWKDSGLTAKEFAAEAGLKASALYYWCSQLSTAARKDAEGWNESSEQSVPSRRTHYARQEKRSAMSSPRFVELPVAAMASAPAMLESLLGDVRVRVPSGFDEATLTRVVRALGGTMIPVNVRIFVCTEPVDMRRGFDSLALLARDKLQHDPRSRALLIITGRRRDRLKALWWDRNGYCILY